MQIIQLHLPYPETESHKSKITQIRPLTPNWSHFNNQFHSFSFRHVWTKRRLHGAAERPRRGRAAEPGRRRKTDAIPSQQSEKRKPQHGQRRLHRPLRRRPHRRRRPALGHGQDQTQLRVCEEFPVGVKCCSFEPDCLKKIFGGKISHRRDDLKFSKFTDLVDGAAFCSRYYSNSNQAIKFDNGHKWA